MAGSTRLGADVFRPEPLSPLAMVRRRVLSAPRGGVLPGGPGPGSLCPGETGMGLPPSLGLHGQDGARKPGQRGSEGQEEEAGPRMASSSASSLGCVSCAPIPSSLHLTRSSEIG